MVWSPDADATTDQSGEKAMASIKVRIKILDMQQVTFTGVVQFYY
jgi:hypothetical protein